MDWVNATYNKLEALAVAADRVLGMAVEQCEAWMIGHRAGPPRAGMPDGESRGASVHGDGARRGRSLSA
jgi:hypothetical protein